MCAIYYLKPDEKANFINETDGVEMSEGLLNSKTKTLCSRSRILIDLFGGSNGASRHFWLRSEKATQGSSKRERDKVKLLHKRYPE
jgi:hypothetical protein